MDRAGRRSKFGDPITLGHPFPKSLRKLVKAFGSPWEFWENFTNPGARKKILFPKF